MATDGNDISGEMAQQIANLEAAIANQRVLLAKIKFKRKRLGTHENYQALLRALEQDIHRQLTKLQKQLQKLISH